MLMKTILKNSKVKHIYINTSYNKDIELIEEEIYKKISDSEGVVREMNEHILKAGGKRLRPLLVLYSGMIFSEGSQELMDAAVAAELIHMASLVHDDIIDKSDLRRNKPSVNNKWGTHCSVLCGDYLFAKAFEILSNKKLSNAMCLMVEAIKNMCNGEIEQSKDRFEKDISIERYYDRIIKKTGILIQNCCKVGAGIGGANDAQIQAMGNYGINMGIAFQIIDDILDYRGNVNSMGKPKGEDMLQGTTTLPIILLKKDERYSEWIEEVISGGKFSLEILDEINIALESSGVLEESYEKAKIHIKRARRSLEIVNNNEYTEFLDSLAHKVLNRKN